MTEWLRPDGTIVPGDAEWPPQGCYWRRDGGGPWLPIPGRTPLCLQMPVGGIHGCEKGECVGCLNAGGPWQGEDGVGPWTAGPYFAALAEKRRLRDAGAGPVHLRSGRGRGGRAG